MRGRNTHTHSRVQQRGGRKADNYHAQPSIQAGSWKASDFGGGEEHDGDDGGAVAAENLATDGFEAFAEKIGISAELGDFVDAAGGAIFALDDMEGGAGLGGADGGHACGVEVGGCGSSDVVY